MLALLHRHGDPRRRFDVPLRYAGYFDVLASRGGRGQQDKRGKCSGVHQFDKVEMLSCVRPEDSRDEHLLAIEEELVQEPGIPYRVVNVATGALGLSAAKRYDIEAWFPGQQHFREITSTSNTTDFRARRLGIRYRPKQGGRRRCTFNGTAVDTCSLIAIRENLRAANGSVAVPPVLERSGALSRMGAAG